MNFILGVGIALASQTILRIPTGYTFLLSVHPSSVTFVPLLKPFDGLDDRFRPTLVGPMSDIYTVPDGEPRLPRSSRFDKINVRRRRGG